MKPLLNTALQTFDQVGYRLDDYGIAQNINRHQVIAYLMSEQKRLEGEIDCFTARVGTRRVQLERLVGRVEDTARSGVNLALAPARFTVSSVRGLLGRA